MKISSSMKTFQFRGCIEANEQFGKQLFNEIYPLSLEQLGENPRTKFKDLKDETRRVLLHGSDKEIKYRIQI